MVKNPHPHSPSLTLIPRHPRPTLIPRHSPSFPVTHPLSPSLALIPLHSPSFPFTHPHSPSLTNLYPACGCHPEGSKSFDCDLYNGQCDCNPQIVGDKCDTSKLTTHSEERILTQEKYLLCWDFTVSCYLSLHKNAASATQEMTSSHHFTANIVSQGVVSGEYGCTVGAVSRVVSVERTGVERGVGHSIPPLVATSPPLSR